ncbi:beta-1,3-galactosyltransferase 1-like [Saccoglossus kowalevskii]|uniref:Hexosyltransferase n=1 Tax=Saccoglossus kowalevskii TaxID=10224 RepID=A0ABM0N0G9_SACKO|nr:PREDICTED: beta-1,3-galactosyltransferase 1-like [Saccoglossus kowalevskii]
MSVKLLFILVCFIALMSVLYMIAVSNPRKRIGNAAKLVARYRGPISVEGRALLDESPGDYEASRENSLLKDVGSEFINVHNRSDYDVESKFFETVLNVNTVPIQENTEDFRDIAFTINHPKKCMDSGGRVKEIDLLILVATRITNENERKNIRKTWGNVNFYDGLRVVILFLVGNPKYTHHEYFHRILSEDVKHNDIIGGNFEDSYYKLTLKTIMGLKWAHVHCPLAKFVMKCDDDILLQPHNIMKYNIPKSRTLIGSCGNRSVVDQRPGSSEPDWQYEVYPAYCSGTAYLISGDLVAELYTTALQTSMFKYEDVFIGMLMYKLGLPVYQHTAFRSSMFPDSACNIRDLVVSHHFSNMKYGPNRLSPVEYRMLIAKLWWQLRMIRRGYQRCPSDVSGLGDKPGKPIYTEEIQMIENRRNFTIN